ARSARATGGHAERPERQARDRERRVGGATQPDAAGKHDALPAGRERDAGGAEAVLEREGSGGGELPRRAAGERQGRLLEPAGGARRRALEARGQLERAPFLAHGARADARPIGVAGAAPLEVGERVGRARRGDAERGRLHVERAARCAAPEAVEGEARAGAVGDERAVERALDGCRRARGALLAWRWRHSADHGVREHEAPSRVSVRRLEPAPVEPHAPARGARDARVEGLEPRERDAGEEAVGGWRAGREPSLQRGLAERRAYHATHAMRPARAAEGELTVGPGPPPP